MKNLSIGAAVWGILFLGGCRTTPPDITKAMRENAAAYENAMRTVDAELKTMAGYATNCPPENFFLVEKDGRKTKAVTPPNTFKETYQTRLFKVGEEYVVKVLDPEADHGMRRAVRNEQVVMNIIDPNSLIHPEGVSPICAGRMVVTQFRGKYTLADILEIRPVRVARIAIALIGQIEKLHSAGFVHGDIHGSNVVFASLEEALWIIDFGRSVPFVSSTGRHVPETYSLHPSVPNPKLASPWELKGYPSTRRDDMYRISELLLRLLHVFPSFGKQESYHAIAGKKETFSVINYWGPVFGEFHAYTLHLKFAQRPNYKEWISRFKKYVDNTFGSIQPVVYATN